MKKIIILAIVVWGLIAPLTYHPDTKLTLEYAALDNGKVWDIYGYLNKNKLEIPDFHYPPVHFYWLKVNYAVSKFIGGSGFDNWLKTNSGEAFLDKDVFKFNLASKVPLLFLGLITGWAIYKIVKKITGKESRAGLAAIIWYFNPVTLYSLVIMGQNDIVAIALFVIGMLVYEYGYFSIFLFVMAAGVKSYPLIWAVLFILNLEKIWFKKIFKVGLVMAGYGLILLPWIGKSYFAEAVLNSGLSQRMMIAGISVGFEKTILVIPLILLILCFKSLQSKGGLIKAVEINLVASIVILGFSHFNPQWLMWVIFFGTIYWSTKKIVLQDFWLISLVFLSWIVLILSFDDRFLIWGIISPINPGLINFPTLVEFIKNRGGSLVTIVDLAQTSMAAVAIWWLVSCFRKFKRDVGEIKLEIKDIYIFIPWLLTIAVVIVVGYIKTDKVTVVGVSNKEEKISSLENRQWTYEISKNTRYIEVPLSNDGLGSKDESVVVIKNDSNNVIYKPFSGYNSEDRGWLRIDLPKNWIDEKYIKISMEKTKIVDGNLTASLDNQNRWAIRIISSQRIVLSDLVTKFISIWWWWVVLGGISIWYLLIKK